MKSPGPERVGSAAPLPVFSSYARGEMRRRNLLAIRAYRYVEERESAKPLRELNLMGEGFRYAVLFLCAASLINVGVRCLL